MRNNIGFSIIELMVAVGVLGIMAAIAIPNYIAYVRRATANEAKAMLSSYYQSYNMMLVEFGCAVGNFPNIGFKPLGEIAYRIQAGNDNTCKVPVSYLGSPPPPPLTGFSCTSTEGKRCSDGAEECCVKIGGKIFYNRSWEETETAISCGSGVIDTATHADDSDPYTFRAFACAKFEHEQNDQIWMIDESKCIRVCPFDRKRCLC